MATETRPRTEWVVVWDPRGEVPEGTILRGDEKGRRLDALARNGVVLLPIDASLVALGGALGGWFKRCYGEGVEVSGMRGTRVVPVALHVEPDREFVHFAVRLVPPAGKAHAPGTARGQFRLVSDTSGSTQGMTGGLSALELPGQAAHTDDLGPADAAGGWTLRRAYRLSCAMRGLFLAQVYGVATGVAVAWVAVSQARVGQT